MSPPAAPAWGLETCVPNPGNGSRDVRLASLPPCAGPGVHRHVERPLCCRLGQGSTGVQRSTGLRRGPAWVLSLSLSVKLINIPSGEGKKRKKA